MDKSIFLPFFILLSGCTYQIHGQDRFAEHRSLCVRHGYKIGTREFDRCMREHEHREKEQNFRDEKTQARSSGNWDRLEKFKAKEFELSQKP